jgi:hypothetical protein
LQSDPARDNASVEETPSSWFTIMSVLLLELLAAVAIAATVAQAYIAYECGDSAYREKHLEQCRGGFPYPLR